MPAPVSRHLDHARSPSTRVATDSQPPFGIASRALRNRLRNTCCSLYSMPQHDRRRGATARAAPGCCRPSNWCSSSESTSLMTALRSTGARSVAAWPPRRDRLSRPLTIFAARNVCRSIFSSSCVCGSSGSAPLEQHLREARDAGERRVHLVRHAGRQQADRRHLLGDLQLLLELHALGHVLDDDDRSRRRRAPRPVAPAAARRRR